MNARLSSPIESMKKHYNAVVIGSGYGGGIAASRLARSGQSVCLLERGREIRPGEYPDTEVEGLEEMQVHAPDGHVGKETGLFDFHVQEDINVSYVKPKPPKPPPAGIKDLKDGTTLTPSERIDIEVEGTVHRLHIKQVVLNDDGEYMVTVGVEVSKAPLHVEGKV